jgi:hypothetical protein
LRARIPAAVTATVAAIAALTAAAPADAAGLREVPTTSRVNAVTPQAPAFLGHPKAWGEATIPPTSSTTRTVKPMTVSVGGGTWNYGSSEQGTQKGCWSDYEHDSKTHSATAILGPATDKEYGDPGYWADSYVEDGYGNTCQVYWATY